MFGVVAVTNAFLPALRRSARPRIVNVSSGTGSLTWATEPQSRHWSGRYAAYRSSKTALNALTVFYAHTLADDDIKVNALAPGLRRTGLNPAATLYKLALFLTLAVSSSGLFLLRASICQGERGVPFSKNGLRVGRIHFHS